MIAVDATPKPSGNQLQLHRLAWVALSSNLSDRQAKGPLNVAQVTLLPNL